ncbi:hypothetical protein T10_7608 [Trichinella papuae]|uniref:Uncharacterized protein n=1 Tax=Trichinella papuae TaxID=268474 RepID=A0A0V1LXP0_9BILA|nr:hypothetical protein T10_7608 [Trichinella papuae]
MRWHTVPEMTYQGNCTRLIQPGAYARPLKPENSLFREAVVTRPLLQRGSTLPLPYRYPVLAPSGRA